MVKAHDLPLTITKFTQNDGNCLFCALSDLLQYRHIRQGLSDEVLSAGSSHTQLRQAVIDLLERLDAEGNHAVFNAAKTGIIQVHLTLFHRTQEKQEC